MYRPRIAPVADRQKKGVRSLLLHPLNLFSTSILSICAVRLDRLANFLFPAWSAAYRENRRNVALTEAFLELRPEGGSPMAQFRLCGLGVPVGSRTTGCEVFHIDASGEFGETSCCFCWRDKGNSELYRQPSPVVIIYNYAQEEDNVDSQNLHDCHSSSCPRHGRDCPNFRCVGARIGTRSGS